MSVFDERTLNHLVEATDDPSFVAGLLSIYRGLLDRRVERITATVVAGDLEAALDAARSLKGGSLMTGVVELAALAIQFEDDLRVSDFAASRARLDLLRPAADRAAVALDAYVEQSRIAQVSAELSAQVSVESIR